jgi:hypothetical protein
MRKIYLTEEEKRAALRESARRRHRLRKAAAGAKNGASDVYGSFDTDRAMYWQDLLGEVERDKLLAIVAQDIADGNY